MARRGGGRVSSPSRRSPSPAARRPAPAPVQSKAPVPVQQPPTAVASPAAGMGGGGGMMANIASTAAGVAIGHTIGHAITGSFSGGSDAPAPVENSVGQQQQAPGQQSSGNPCEHEFRRFIECTQEQSDISLCEGFNQVFKDCKIRSAGAGY